MADKNKKDDDPIEMGWGAFEKFFGGKLPFSPTGGGENMAWVENYVKEVMKQALPSATAQIKSADNPIHTELFETHNSVVLKAHIPDRTMAKQVNVLVGEHQVRLENLPNKGKQTVRLNNLVNPDSCRAVYKNGILQLHMRKQTYGDYYHSVDVRFL
ncbi:Hsp20/alpha crystallin family protein [Paenibacillus thalictri]|uniref:Hsp20/alpha crystallin family protein n=1 Tax=Paenibacillus thalictri TaxID=2527873 RepID=A0A4Q9DL50_9BACL|nr:Hsp20/alpha crystallin family protein [Paenibacillus thalictri]TBL73055.1 hypothetical protein EYB31_27910 [Paenibacillus thalictri]